jgi:hypothetical protein
MSIRKRFAAQVVVPCTVQMKQAVVKTAIEFGLSNADVARMCIEEALGTVRSRLAADRDHRTKSLAVDPNGLAAAS